MHAAVQCLWAVQSDCLFFLSRTQERDDRRGEREEPGAWHWPAVGCPITDFILMRGKAEIVIALPRA